MTKLSPASFLCPILVLLCTKHSTTFVTSSFIHDDVSEYRPVSSMGAVRHYRQQGQEITPQKRKQRKLAKQDDTENKRNTEPTSEPNPSPRMTPQPTIGRQNSFFTNAPTTGPSTLLEAVQGTKIVEMDLHPFRLVFHLDPTSPAWESSDVDTLIELTSQHIQQFIFSKNDSCIGVELQRTKQRQLKQQHKQQKHRIMNAMRVEVPLQGTTIFTSNDSLSVTQEDVYNWQKEAFSGVALNSYYTMLDDNNFFGEDELVSFSVRYDDNEKQPMDESTVKPVIVNESSFNSALIAVLVIVVVMLLTLSGAICYFVRKGKITFDDLPNSKLSNFKLPNFNRSKSTKTDNNNNNNRTSYTYDDGEEPTLGIRSPTSICSNGSGTLPAVKNDEEMTTHSYNYSLEGATFMTSASPISGLRSNASPAMAAAGSFSPSRNTITDDSTLLTEDTNDMKYSLSGDNTTLSSSSYQIGDTVVQHHFNNNTFKFLKSSNPSSLLTQQLRRKQNFTVLNDDYDEEGTEVMLREVQQHREEEHPGEKVDTFKDENDLNSSSIAAVAVESSFDGNEKKDKKNKRKMSDLLPFNSGQLPSLRLRKLQSGELPSLRLSRDRKCSDESKRGVTGDVSPSHSEGKSVGSSDVSTLTSVFSLGSGKSNSKKKKNTCSSEVINASDSRDSGDSILSAVAREIMNLGGSDRKKSMNKKQNDKRISDEKKPDAERFVSQKDKPLSPVVEETDVDVTFGSQEGQIEIETSLPENILINCCKEPLQESPADSFHNGKTESPQFNTPPAKKFDDTKGDTTGTDTAASSAFASPATFISIASSVSPLTPHSPGSSAPARRERNSPHNKEPPQSFDVPFDEEAPFDEGPPPIRSSKKYHNHHIASCPSPEKTESYGMAERTIDEDSSAVLEDLDRLRNILEEKKAVIGKSSTLSSMATN